MSCENDRGRSPLQEGLDRNQAEGCCQGYCGHPEQEQANDMPREQGEEILFANRPRRPMRFVVDLQDALKP
ncbi:MAG TPA: hypothetical protein VHY37_09765 [Tepidisphaeraceae bacterium]|nr:hypothetical protein [Tepidisphaeraceae bacterium]